MKRARDQGAVTSKTRIVCLCALLSYSLIPHLASAQSTNTYLYLDAYWPFNGDCVDYSGHGNDGSGGVDVLARFGHGRYFPSYISIPGSGGLDSYSNMSICLWFNPSEIDPGDAIIIRGDHSESYWQIYLDQSAVFASFNQSYLLQPQASTLSINNWYHLAAVYEGTAAVLYVHSAMGVLLSSNRVGGSANGVVDVVDVRPVSCGYHTWSGGSASSIGQQRLKGTIDEVSIWRRALKREEVDYLSKQPLSTDVNSNGLFDLAEDIDGDGLAYFDDTDDDGDGLSDNYERGVGRFSLVNGGWTWSQAVAHAASLGGYLATIRSSDEQLGLELALGAPPAGSRWIGASDSAVEGVWRWMTGPETGLQFASGANALPGFYAPWDPGEPNNQGGIQHYCRIISGKWTWDDGPCCELIGFVLETGYYTRFDDPDTDDDGFGDKAEIDQGLSPVVANGAEDFDGDTIPNHVEWGNQMHYPADADDDGLPDFRDADSDNDLIPDSVEAGPTPSTPRNTDGTDNPDYLDTDSDNDLIPDSVEAGPTPSSPRNTDGADDPDYRDTDSDNDLIPDSVEAGPTPSDPRNTDGADDPDYRDLDSDNDLISDSVEAGPNPSSPRNTDGTDDPDYQDVDSDNDGIPDGVEDANHDGVILGDLNGNRILDNPPETWMETDALNANGDADGDSVYDRIEDYNHDGWIEGDSNTNRILDGVEVWTETDPLNSDSDGDGILDGLEDNDGDGLVPMLESQLSSNHYSADSNSNGTPDVIEYGELGLGVSSIDSDADGMPDTWEIAHGLNPRINDAEDDHDLDWVSNLAEYLSGGNPSNMDSDADGTNDYEVIHGAGNARYSYDRIDRLLAAEYARGFALAYKYDGNGNMIGQGRLALDQDQDGLPDWWEFIHGLSVHSSSGNDGLLGDADGDGWSNYQEQRAGTDPRSAASRPDLNPSDTGVMRQTPPLTRIMVDPSAGAGISIVKLRTWDAEGNAVSPIMQYLEPASTNWTNATIMKIDGMTYTNELLVSSAPTGTTHKLLWNAAHDLGLGYTNRVTLRARSRDQSSWGVWSQILPYALRTTPDSDGDGLPDTWEIDNGLNPVSSNGLDGAAADADGDGVNNRDEYAADTHPGDSQSFLRISTLQRIGSSSWVTWLGGTGSLQYLQYADDVASTGANWKTILTNYPPVQRTNTAIVSEATNAALHLRIEAVRP